jgi:hypothetical protein
MAGRIFTDLQIVTLRAVEAGNVMQKNFGTGAWRIVGANPGSLGRLVSLGYVKWTEIIGGTAQLTEAGREALSRVDKD